MLKPGPAAWFDAIKIIRFWLLQILDISFAGSTRMTF
jgi:hypothetical protein